MARGSVRKKGKKWYYRFYVEDESGRQVQREFAGTESKSETEALLRKAMEDYEAKKFVAKSDNLTVGDLLDLWVEEELKPGNLSNGTVMTYTTTINQIKKHPIGKRKLKTVTADHLQSYIDFLSFGGTNPDGTVSAPKSKGYMRTFSAVLQGAFRFAVFPKRLISFSLLVWNRSAGTIDRHFLIGTEHPHCKVSKVIPGIKPCLNLWRDDFQAGLVLIKPQHFGALHPAHEVCFRECHCYLPIPSQNLCRRLGMRQEGLFREFVSFVNNPDGTPKYENTMQFAILKKEWDADITKQVSIEEANHDDMPVLEAIHDAAFDTDMRYFPDGKLPGPEEGEFAPTSSEALDLPGYTILKVLLNGKIVGGACVSAAKNGIREIEEFYISPEYMGRNIGATTLSLVEDYFPNTKVYRLITPTQVMKNIVFYVNKCHYHIVEVAGYDRKQECGDYVFEKRMTR